MPYTQHRPLEALAGKRFGSFSGKPASSSSSHPVGVLTQHLAMGVVAGRRYGSFAGKGASGTDFDLEVPTEGPALVGAFSASGDFQFITVSPFDLTQSTATAFAGSFGASGDFSFEREISVAETGPAAFSGVFGASGDFGFSDAPIRKRGGGRNYIIKGKRYYNLTPDELAFLIRKELIDVGRDDVKVNYGKKQKTVSKSTWATLESALKSLETFDDDEDEIAAMLLL